MYCAQQVEKKVEKATAGAGDPNKVVVKTDVIDRRPAPGGLARYGVAPDHAPSVSAVSTPWTPSYTVGKPRGSSGTSRYSFRPFPPLP